MIVDTDNLISISDANNRGISGLAADAESGREFVLLRRDKPIAAVVGMHKLQRLQELEDMEEDLTLLCVALARTVTDNGTRTRFDKVLAHFGIDEADLVSPDA